MALQHNKLMLKVAKHDALNGCGGCCNSTATEQASYGPEYEATHATKPVATTATTATPLQLGAKNGPMALLV